MKWVDASNVAELAAGFDQEVAAVTVARWASFKTETSFLLDVLRWLDQLLIKLCARFGNYQKNNPSSLSLPANFTMFPQFLYHLRRSQFLRVFNSSPDETTFYRQSLNRETVNNCILMIQPSLTCYSMQEPAHAVLLDSMSVKPDTVLVLDTYFFIVVHYGETIAGWRDAGYHLQPKYTHLANVLTSSKRDAEQMILDRFPAAKLIECDEYSSQARFLSAKVNPSTTHHSQQQFGGQGGQEFKILTDDASLQVFMDSLKKLAVTLE